MQRVAIVIIVLLVATLSSSSPRQPTEAVAITNYVSGITAGDGATATQQPGSLPAPSDGPSVSVTAASSVAPADSTSAQLQSVSPFQTVYVTVSNRGQAVNGFWQVRLPNPISSAVITVKLGTQLPSSSFDIVYSVATAAGAVGAQATVPTRVVGAGHDVANLQIALSPDPVPYGGRTCAVGGVPQPFTWNGITVRIHETNGVPFTVVAWHGNWHYNGLSSQRFDYPIGNFASYFSACGNGSTTIPANGTFCSGTSDCFGATVNTFRWHLSVDGVDANGHSLSFSSQTVTMLPPGR